MKEKNKVFTRSVKQEFQTRDDSGELRYFSKLSTAMQYARMKDSVWKVSFDAKNGERVRLTREPGSHWFRYDPIFEEESNNAS